MDISLTPKCLNEPMQKKRLFVCFNKIFKLAYSIHETTGTKMAMKLSKFPFEVSCREISLFPKYHETQSKPTLC